MVSSPRTNTLKACWISKAPGRAFSMFSISFSESPLSVSDCLFTYGEFSRDMEPMTYCMISLTSVSSYPSACSAGPIDWFAIFM